MMIVSEGVQRALSRLKASIDRLQASVDRLGGWLECAAWVLLGAGIAVTVAAAAVLL